MQPERSETGKRKFYKISIRNILFLDSSMVEHSAVNRVVVGSSPTRGAVAAATEARKHQCLRAFYYKQKKENARKKQAVKC